MTTSKSPFKSRSLPQHQRGLALLIALIVLAAMTLAGIALVRSVETATNVSGNIVARAGARAYGDACMRRAISVLVNQGGTATLDGAQLEADSTTNGYFSFKLPETKKPGVPDLLVVGGTAGSVALPDFSAATPSTGFATSSFDAASRQVCTYVLDRMCLAAGAGVEANCRVLASGDENYKRHDPLVLGDSRPVYRITVRIDAPKNTVSFFQTMLRDI